MALTYEDLPERPLPGHRRFLMGVFFRAPMSLPQVKLQREGKDEFIVGFTPPGQPADLLQFSNNRNEYLGYMRGSLEGLPMRMRVGSDLLQVYDEKNRHLATVAPGMTSKQGMVDPSGRWCLALVGSEMGVLRTMKFHYAIIVPHKKKFFRKLSGKPDPEERVGYIHGQRGQAMFGISVMGLPSIQPGAFASFDGEFTLDIDKSVNVLMALALFFRQNAIFEFQEVMPGH
jgi:hypothetical protein